MTAPPETFQDDRDHALLREQQARETALYLAMRWQARADDDTAKREPASASTPHHRFEQQKTKPDDRWTASGGVPCRSAE